MLELTKMANDFTSHIASATSMDDTHLASLIFKSLEVGSLKPENALATLEKYGISLSFNRDYFYVDPSHNHDVSSAENHIFNNHFEGSDKV